MKWQPLAARFYRAPSAKNILAAVQDAMPQEPAKWQHAYAMHIYCRISNEGIGGESWQTSYVTGYPSRGPVTLRMDGVATIQPVTLVKYLDYVQL